MAALAFYGDSEGSEVFAIDISAMSLLCRIPTGLGPYPVDAVGRTHVLASTRKEQSVTPIEIATLTALPKVSLSHKPRSSSTHDNGLTLVSGADQPITTVIDSRTWTVLRTYGEPLIGRVEDFGGQLASGHERWLPDGDRFFILDRLRRRISLYRHSTAELLWSVNTPTSCHHVVPDPAGSGTYFAMCEGNQSAKIPPSVMKLVPNGFAFLVEAHSFLSIEPASLSACGGHHVDAFGDHLYCGSNEGFTYVLRKDTLAPVTRIVTGPGNGHTGFIQDSGQSLGLTINHTAQFITIFDLITHTPLRSVQVSTASATPTRRTQGHTSGKLGPNFYMMASLDSTFREIDALTGTITRSLPIPAKDASSALPFPMQGVFILDAPGAHCTQCC
jgi:hypothetical protein